MGCQPSKTREDAPFVAGQESPAVSKRSPRPLGNKTDDVDTGFPQQDEEILDTTSQTSLHNPTENSGTGDTEPIRPTHQHFATDDQQDSFQNSTNKGTSKIEERGVRKGSSGSISNNENDKSKDTYEEDLRAITTSFKDKAADPKVTRKKKEKKKSSSKSAEKKKKAKKRHHHLLPEENETLNDVEKTEEEPFKEKKKSKSKSKKKRKLSKKKSPTTAVDPTKEEDAPLPENPEEPIHLIEESNSNDFVSSGNDAHDNDNDGTASATATEPRSKCRCQGRRLQCSLTATTANYT